MGKDFFRGNNFNKPNNVRNNFQQVKEVTSPVQDAVKEQIQEEVTSHVQNAVKEQISEEIVEPVQCIKKNNDFKKTNYLELDKQEKENLNYNGVLFKHGTIANCNVLNFREKPNKGAKVIGTFNFGENILYSETNDPEWFMLKNKEGKIGYCMSEFIKIEV